MGRASGVPNTRTSPLARSSTVKSRGNDYVCGGAVAVCGWAATAPPTAEEFTVPEQAQLHVAKPRIARYFIWDRPYQVQSVRDAEQGGAQSNWKLFRSNRDGASQSAQGR